MRDVRIPPLGLPGTLRVPPDARTVVAFAIEAGAAEAMVRGTEAMKVAMTGTVEDDLSANIDADRALLRTLHQTNAKTCAVVQQSRAAVEGSQRLLELVDQLIKPRGGTLAL